MSRPFPTSRPFAVLVAICALFLTMPDLASANQPPGLDARQESMVAAKRQSGILTTWIQALETAGLAATLEQDGPVTVFAPSDDAFAKLPPGTLEALLRPTNRDKLVSIQNYHIVQGKVSSATVIGRELDLETADGIDITVDGLYDLKVNDAKVLIADIEVANGIIHVVNSVVSPN